MAKDIRCDKESIEGLKDKTKSRNKTSDISRGRVRAQGRPF
jgi:hypothetical protein